VFAQFVQGAHGKVLYGFTPCYRIQIVLLPTAGAAWLSNWLDAINNGTNSLFLTIGPGDFLVHHAFALGIHTTVLILVKGALMPVAAS